MSVEAVASDTLAAIRQRGTHRRMRVLSGAQVPWFESLAQAAVKRPRGKACILLWMDGGPSQQHTFDPKPGGEFKPQPTSVPGIHIVEQLPKIARCAEDLVIEKESASAFAGTHLAGYLISQQCDSVLITGCSTSACIRATATDAKSLRLKPVLVGDCCGDRAAAAHVFTLFDIQARFADVVDVETAIGSLASA